MDSERPVNWAVDGGGKLEAVLVTMRQVVSLLTQFPSRIISEQNSPPCRAQVAEAGFPKIPLQHGDVRSRLKQRSQSI